MTAIGKIMVFMIFILTLAWSGLVVNAFVTRTNWRTMAERAQKNAKEAEASANEMKKELDATRTSLEDQIRALRDTNARLYAERELNTKDREDLRKQFSELFTNEQKDNTLIAEHQANKNKALEQVGNLDILNKEKQARLEKLTVSEEKARIDWKNSVLEEEAQRKRADRLAQELQEKSSLVQEFLARGVQLDPLSTKKPAAPAGYRGRITKVEQGGSRGEYLIEFAPGLDSGLLKNTVLKVQRSRDGFGKFVGKAVVTIVEPKIGGGRILIKANAAPDDAPKVGDDLVPETEN